MWCERKTHTQVRTTQVGPRSALTETRRVKWLRRRVSTGRMWGKHSKQLWQHEHKQSKRNWWIYSKKWKWSVHGVDGRVRSEMSTDRSGTSSITQITHRDLSSTLFFSHIFLFQLPEKISQLVYLFMSDLFITRLWRLKERNHVFCVCLCVPNKNKYYTQKAVSAILCCTEHIPPAPVVLQTIFSTVTPMERSKSLGSLASDQNEGRGRNPTFVK